MFFNLWWPITFNNIELFSVFHPLLILNVISQMLNGIRMGIKRIITYPHRNEQRRKIANIQHKKNLERVNLIWFNVIIAYCTCLYKVYNMLTQERRALLRSERAWSERGKQQSNLCREGVLNLAHCIVVVRACYAQNTILLSLHVVCASGFILCLSTHWDQTLCYLTETSDLKGIGDASQPSLRWLVMIFGSWLLTANLKCTNSEIRLVL